MKTSIAAEAARTGSTPVQVTAAITILKSEDQVLLHQVLRGEVPLAVAAKRVKRLAALVSAYRNATDTDLIKAAKVIGGAYVSPTSDVSAVWSTNNEVAESGQESPAFATE
jgi:hypothetical protein